MIEVPDFNFESFDTLEKGDVQKDEEKLLELQYLLATQLETQKQFFEERIHMLEKQTRNKIAYLEEEFAEMFQAKLETEKQKKWLELHAQQIQREKETKVRELQEQVRDLMFYIEAQNKLSSNSELKDGQVLVVPTPQLTSATTTTTNATTEEKISNTNLQGGPTEKHHPHKKTPKKGKTKRKKGKRR
jgi:BRCA1-associated protein